MGDSLMLSQVDLMTLTILQYTQVCQACTTYLDYRPTYVGPSLLQAVRTAIHTYEQNTPCLYS